MKNNFKKNIVAFSIVSLFAVSCSQNKEIEPTILESETATTTTETATNAPTIVASNPEAVVNGGQISAPNVTTTTVNPSAQKVAPGMNPPHGEPNHRCDISVGAPLNSPPGKSAAAAPQTIPQPQTVTPAAAPAPVANPLNLAVNPAHGEPGHSCAIAVGAPFK